MVIRAGSDPISRYFFLRLSVSGKINKPFGSTKIMYGPRVIVSEAQCYTYARN